MSPLRHPLAGGRPEPWAATWGEDRYGPRVGFAVLGVVQRMRWIPPGRFLMGSPKSEAGRSYDEAQHEVEIRRGFWLGDTPVTQALWTAVMGDNPSRFQSPDRPVEQVSWQDGHAFLTRLNALVPCLDARLPSEAEWEHACRAGTTGATWAGELDLLGDNNAPRLDDIAWYGGNSGQGFELSNGVDSSEWPEKQYPHTRAGTRPVRLKRPNPLGLYDMLGNVYEWCEDWYGAYSAEPVVDPRGPSAGSLRVIRGGSWGSYARYVRAANRHAYDPSYRYENLGVRVARGQVPEAVRGGGAPSAGERSRRP